jgi:hypothetical protein
MSQGRGGKMGRKKQAAIAALLSSSSIALASEACGVSPATLKRWMMDPDFRGAFDAEGRRLLEFSSSRVRAGTDLALDTLRRNMEDGPAAVQVSAVRAWLDHQRQSDLADALDAHRAVGGRDGDQTT